MAWHCQRNLIKVTSGKKKEWVCGEITSFSADVTTRATRLQASKRASSRSLHSSSSPFDGVCGAAWRGIRCHFLPLYYILVWSLSLSGVKKEKVYFSFTVESYVVVGQSVYFCFWKMLGIYDSIFYNSDSIYIIQLANVNANYFSEKLLIHEHFGLWCILKDPP